MGACMVLPGVVAWGQAQPQYPTPDRRRAQRPGDDGTRWSTGGAFFDAVGGEDLDIIITQVAGAPLLPRYDQALGHHWLRVWLKGRPPNLAAIGARLELAARSVTQRRQVLLTRSYLSQAELPVTFGLEAGDRVERLDVHWPDGTVQTIADPPVDQVLVVEQPAPDRRSSASAASPDLTR
jgi:hypothetical protein